MPSRPKTVHTALIALFLLPALAACGNDEGSDGSQGAAGGSTVQVTASDKTCDIDQAAFAAGPTTVKVKNTGSQTTEVYVYGADGAAFNKVMSEVENIGPGTSREMKVDLVAGGYEIACKPGQKGDGIRTKITVSGEGGAKVKAADRSVAFTTIDYTFEGLTTSTVKLGETIKFEMVNTGLANHEFELFGPDSKVIGEIGPTKSGDQANVTFTFDKTGTYSYICDVDDHLARGMKGTFVVG